MSRRKNRHDDSVEPAQRHNTGLTLRGTKPLTENQARAFDNFHDFNLVLHGLAGTGKTFIAVYLALREAMKGTVYRQVTIVRSIVSTRDPGFLPGNLLMKGAPYEAPYSEVCTELFGRGDAYSILKRHNIIDFTTTSFIRGKTLRDCVVLVDEVQNMTLHELDSVITRIGSDSKIVFLGDYSQSDFTKSDDRAGLKEFLRVLERMPEHFLRVEFNESDIVRSDLVRDYILSKNELSVRT